MLFRSNVQNDKGRSALMFAAQTFLWPIVIGLVAAGAKPEMMDKDRMTSLSFACVKLRDISVAAETAVNILAGCWVRATKIFKLNKKKSKIVPKDYRGVIQEIDQNGRFCDVSIDFGSIGGKWKLRSSKFDKIVVLAFSDHVLLTASGKPSLLPDVALLKKRAQRKEVVEMLVSPTQAAGALDVPNNERCTHRLDVCCYAWA